MSDLAKSFAKAKLSSLPPEPPLFEDQEREDDSSSASSMSSTGTVVPTTSQRPAPTVGWADFYAQELYLEEQSERGHAKFHVYVTPPKSSKAPLLVLHHGAGSSALSFALFAREIQKHLPDTGILAVEARDHGSVVWGPDGHVDTDLSIETLSQDLVDMVRLTKLRMGWEKMPTIVLVGHSLGGAVVTHTASNDSLGNSLLGYTVIDVVEGSAIEALKHMNSYLATRPTSFPSIESAIDWHIRSRTLRNPQAAHASVPSLLLQTPSGAWTWRTGLATTEQYWGNWFTGMSSKFLSAKGAKLLLLAGTDRLDKELTIGQMQGTYSRLDIRHYHLDMFDLQSITNATFTGKFQLQVFPAAGHFVQEDQPEKTAEVIAEFIKRNDRSALVLPPKVSDLLAQGKKV